jgi:hypothetical protein
MYPNTFFGLFPPFPQDFTAFVAMSFDTRFDARWENVISPALSHIQINDIPLEPLRVDLISASDSILTEILDHIARCRVFVADITALNQLNNRAIRNQNVFYEIGLAHATRLPEEVLLFRSDNFDLAFDISNVRVHHYDPDNNPEEARQYVAKTIVNSMRELDIKRNLAVRQAAERLDYESLIVLTETQKQGGLKPPVRETMGQVLSTGARLDAIARLLDLGAIQTKFIKLSEDTFAKSLDTSAEKLVRYVASPFGSVLFDFIVEKMGVTDPKLKDKLDRLAEDGDKHLQ